MILNEENQPKILNLLYNFFYSKPDHFKTTGLMRKNTSILVEQEFEKNIKEGNF